MPPWIKKEISDKRGRGGRDFRLRKKGKKGATTSIPEEDRQRKGRKEEIPTERVVNT